MKKIILLLLLNLTVFSQQSTVDQLLEQLSTASKDTNRLNLLNEIIDQMNEQDEWARYNMEMKTLSLELLKSKDQKVRSAAAIKYGEAINNEGFYFQNANNNKAALSNFYRAAHIFDSIHYKEGTATAYNNIGFFFYNNGDLKTAMTYYKKTYQLQKEKNDLKGIGITCTNLGTIYKTLGENRMAEKYLMEGFLIRKKINDRQGLANSYNNLGMLFYNKNNYDRALFYYNKSIELRQQLNDTKGSAPCYNNIGGIYTSKGNYEEGLKYHLKALELRKKFNDLLGEIGSYNSIAKNYLMQKKFKEAKEYAEKALQLSTENNYFIEKKNAANYLYLINNETGNYKDALKMLLLKNSVEDTLLSETTKKEMLSEEIKSDLKVKMVSDSLRNAEQIRTRDLKIEANETRIKQERTVKIALIAGLALLVIFLLVMVNRFNLIKKQKAIIEEKSKQSEEQKLLIEEKQNEIISSINYAKRLQEAILPEVDSIRNSLKDSFVLFLPKDIVAGDFYFYEKLNDTVIIAAADCTGHGVPGAMVSMVCSNALTRAVKEFGIQKPSEILEKVRTLVIETFEKSKSDVKDGMDISLVSIRYSGDKAIVNFAGANNPLWYFNKEGFHEIKGNKQPIGKFELPVPFVNHQLELDKGDLLYLFTDGFADQFGGSKGKKFKYKGMQQLLESHQNLSMQEQHMFLQQALKEWMCVSDVSGQSRAYEQVDDICVIGIRV